METSKTGPKLLAIARIRHPAGIEILWGGAAQGAQVVTRCHKAWCIAKVVNKCVFYK